MSRNIKRFKPKYKKGTRIVDLAYPDCPEGKPGTIYSFIYRSKSGEEWYSVMWDDKSSGSTREKHFKLEADVKAEAEAKKEEPCEATTD